MMNPSLMIADCYLGSGRFDQAVLQQL
jgi:hypothetical protein